MINDTIIVTHPPPICSLQQYACSYVSSKRATSATGVVTISSGDESSLQVAVGMVGPVSAYVDASHTSFQVRPPLSLITQGIERAQSSNLAASLACSSRGTGR